VIEYFQQRANLNFVLTLIDKNVQKTIWILNAVSEIAVIPLREIKMKQKKPSPNTQCLDNFGI